MLLTCGDDIRFNAVTVWKQINRGFGKCKFKALDQNKLSYNAVQVLKYKSTLEYSAKQNSYVLASYMHPRRCSYNCPVLTQGYQFKFNN